MLKEVDFELYCHKCKHYEKKEEEEPCCECLDNPSNEDSCRPVCYEE